MPNPPPPPPPTVPPPPVPAPPPPPAPPTLCKNYFTTYIIYIPFVRDLVNWKFKFNFCYNGTVVTSASVTDDMQILDPTIMANRDNSHTEGQVPAQAVRFLFSKATFQYCPLTTPISPVCIGTFQPRIDVYLTGTGQVLDVSTL